MSHGLVALPVPALLPPGDAYQPACVTDDAVTVTAAVPLFPSLVAVMVADPPASAVTNPFDETPAMPPALLAHVTTRPVRTFPAESLVTALSCCVAPTSRLADAGVTVTDATGASATVMVAVAVFPSLV